LRAWAVRLLGQLDAKLTAETWQELVKLAQTDPSPDVRLQLASACQRWRKYTDPTEVLHALMARGEDAKDPAIPLLAWVGYEPSVVPGYEKELTWLADHGSSPLISGFILPRGMRRLVATGEGRHLDAALRFLASLDVKPLRASLDGLIEALRGRRLEPTAGWKSATTFLYNHADREVWEKVRELGIHFGHPESLTWAQDRATNAKVE